MPASSISLANLSWSTPDGHTVLDGITLDFGQERVGLVGRNGVGKSTILRLIAGHLTPVRGAVRVSGTVGMLRQITQVAAQETVADRLGITPALDVLQKADAGIATTDELAEADWTVETRAREALAAMGLDVDLDTVLASLSGGQRTRAALAGLIFDRPDFLLLDEPTNNLDRDGRRAVEDMLGSWRAGAIVVSHDRALLEHMDAIVELTTLGARRYGGNGSFYRDRKTMELAALDHDLAAAEQRQAEVKRKAQVTAERQLRRDATGRRQAARGGTPRILLGAQRERAENSGAENIRLAARQRDDADRAVEDARARIEIVQPLSFQIAPTGLAPSRDVLSLDHVTAGHEEGHAILRDLSLHIAGPERIAITGANGSGKSTLLQVIAGTIPVWFGRVVRHTGLSLLDQHVSLLSRGSTIVENFARLNPGMDENGCRAALARFRFRADAADQTVRDLSGGQMLRAGLACVLGNATPPPLLMLDEPTNHLDLDGIAAIEDALLAYDGALLVVSHDDHFLERIRITRQLPLQETESSG